MAPKKAAKWARICRMEAGYVSILLRKVTLSQRYEIVLNNCLFGKNIVFWIFRPKPS